MAIRPYRPEDAPQMARLFERSVRELGPLFYSDLQVKAWAARAPSAKRVAERNKDGRLCLVAVDRDEQVLAYGEMERDGHIDHLYALRSVAGTGVVSLLYDALEAEARQMGIERLYTEASEGARRFFLKKDFTEQARRDFEIEGVAIHNYAMDKHL